MSLWKSFLKRNFIWILLAVLLVLVQELYLFLVDAGAQDMIYAALIEFFLILMLCLFGFVRYRQRTVRLKEISHQAAANELTLPEAQDAIEECYQEILENINIDRQLVLGKAGRQQSEMQEYYALWVHQIKTPIAAMQVLLQYRRENSGSEDDEEYRFLADMEDELFHIEQYVGMALQYQHIQSSSSDYVLKKISLDPVIRDTIRKYARTIIRKKLSLQYKGTEETVISDEKWLGFVLEQVLSNAVKYTRDGSITIEVIRAAGCCKIKVADTGIGIQAEDIPRVFEKGYTGYNGHANRRSTGIGLYLCREILTKLGHTIRIESEPGKGTNVWIEIIT